MNAEWKEKSEGIHLRGEGEPTGMISDGNGGKFPTRNRKEDCGCRKLERRQWRMKVFSLFSTPDVMKWGGRAKIFYLLGNFGAKNSSYPAQNPIK